MPIIDYRKNYLERSGAAYDNKSKNIAPTIFNVEFVRKDRTIDIETMDNITLSIFDNTVQSYPYFRVVNNFISIIEKYTRTSILILFYIARDIGYETNIYTADHVAIAKYLGLSEGSIKDCFTELTRDRQVIAATNKPRTYIIDHNKIFKGNLDRFISQYNALYGGRRADVDHSGRVMIR